MNVWDNIDIYRYVHNHKKYNPISRIPRKYCERLDYHHAEVMEQKIRDCNFNIFEYEILEYNLKDDKAEFFIRIKNHSNIDFRKVCFKLDFYDNSDSLIYTEGSNFFGVVFDLKNNAEKNVSISFRVRMKQVLSKTKKVFLCIEDIRTKY